MANEMAAMPAKSREIPTHTTTIVVPNTSGWIKTHSEQSNSRMPLMMVHADPGTVSYTHLTLPTKLEV